MNLYTLVIVSLVVVNIVVNLRILFELLEVLYDVSISHHRKDQELHLSFSTKRSGVESSKKKWCTCLRRLFLSKSVGKLVWIDYAYNAYTWRYTH